MVFIWPFLALISPLTRQWTGLLGSTRPNHCSKPTCTLSKSTCPCANHYVMECASYKPIVLVLLCVLCVLLGLLLVPMSCTSYRQSAQVRYLQLVCLRILKM